MEKTKKVKQFIKKNKTLFACIAVLLILFTYMSVNVFAETAVPDDDIIYYGHRVPKLFTSEICSYCGKTVYSIDIGTEIYYNNDYLYNQFVIIANLDDLSRSVSGDIIPADFNWVGECAYTAYGTASEIGRYIEVRGSGINQKIYTHFPFTNTNNIYYNILVVNGITRDAAITDVFSTISRFRYGSIWYAYTETLALYSIIGGSDGGYDEGYNDGYLIGFDAGHLDSDVTVATGLALFDGIFTAVGNFFITIGQLQILGISMWTLIALPLLFTIGMLILKAIRG